MNIVCHNCKQSLNIFLLPSHLMHEEIPCNCNYIRISYTFPIWGLKILLSNTLTISINFDENGILSSRLYNFSNKNSTKLPINKEFYFTNNPIKIEIMVKPKQQLQKQINSYTLL